ncbi:hypothetical protein MACJ_000389 [Theileria orientalis]|uniref:Uncharacterized protein n=1 Tax=Theileria orientalis TaxID=68886 RepID=A0A976M406_THEOR|nr:hypothetical protein MACJ_000389 [Theileria orientalis]
MEAQHKNKSNNHNKQQLKLLPVRLLLPSVLLLFTLCFSNSRLYQLKIYSEVSNDKEPMRTRVIMNEISFCIICKDPAKPAALEFDEEEKKKKEKKEKEEREKKEKENGNGTQNNVQDAPPKYGFIETFGKAASPFLMYSIGSVLFDTLFPGILPYAFISRERAHMVNMILPIAGALGNSFMDPLSFGGVAKVLFLSGFIPDLGVLIPNHRMSKWNTFWYVLRTTFKKAGRDAISDMTMNVKEYL